MTDYVTDLRDTLLALENILTIVKCTSQLKNDKRLIEAINVGIGESRRVLRRTS